MKLIKDRRGDMFVMVAFIIPITLFILNYTTTYGLGENAKTTVTSAANVAARTYAVTHTRDLAYESAKLIVEKSLSTNSKYFDPEKDIVLEDDGEFCTATVTYRVPVAVPGMYRLIGGNKMLGEYLLVSSTARYLREDELKEGGGPGV